MSNYQATTPVETCKGGGNPFSDKALRLVADGYRPLPAVRDQKRPPFAYQTFFASEVTDENVKRWFDAYGSLDIALVRGSNAGLLVLDIDPKNGGEGSFQQLLAEGLTIPQDTPSEMTPSGGWHYFFKHPQLHSLDLSSKINLRPGIDLLSGDGIVIVAPSYRSDGTRYSSVVPLVPIAELPETPMFLVRLLDKQATQDRKVPLSVEAKQSKATEAGKPELTKADQEVFAAIWEQFHTILTTGDHNYRCVWHDDRSPSLRINSETGLWSCFSCGRGGGLDALIKDIGDGSEYGTTLPRKLLTAMGKVGRKEAWCPTPRSLVVNEKGSRIGRVKSVPCNDPTCPVCGPRMLKEGADWYTERFEQLGASVFILWVPAARWRNMSRRQMSTGALYLRIPDSKGMLTVFTTQRARPVPAGRLWIEVHEALQRRSLSRGHKGPNISSSPELRRPGRAGGRRESRSIGNRKRFESEARRQGLVLAEDRNGVTSIELPKASDPNYRATLSRLTVACKLDDPPAEPDSL